MATFRKRPGPGGRTVWQAQILRLGFKNQYRTFDSRASAEAWARRVESEMDAGAWQDRTEGDRTTLASAFKRYEREITPRKAPSTQRRERHKIAHFTDGPHAQIALSRLTGRDVADHIRKRERDGAKPATIIGELNTLSHLFTVARTSWGMSYLVNPVPLAKDARPKTPHGRERRLEDDEEERLLAAASCKLGIVIRFALATAMRRGEIANLRWGHIDMKRRVVTLGSSDTKNRTARSIPLSPAALDILHDIPRHIDGAVFDMSENAIKLAWARLMKKTEINDLTFHDLRHEAISRLFENTDLDFMEIKAITGHKTLQMLARYTHLRTHRLADRLAGAKRN